MQLVQAALRMDLPVEIKELRELDRLTDVDKFNNFRPHQGVCLECRCFTRAQALVLVIVICKNLVFLDAISCQNNIITYSN